MTRETLRFIAVHITQPNISTQFDVGRDHLHSLGASNAHRVIGGVLSPAHDKYSFNKPGLISSTHRVAMCRAAIQSSDFVRVSAWEAEQEDWTPTRHVCFNFQIGSIQKVQSIHTTMVSKVHQKM